VLVARFIISEAALAKLARRGITPRNLRQLPGNGVVGTRNPRGRMPGSRLLIGATDGGRLLTVVVEPDPTDDAVWHVRTAWDASPPERAIYHRGG
jgi:hypothetical protein